jgi:hypothetical protein
MRIHVKLNEETATFLGAALILVVPVCFFFLLVVCGYVKL